MCFEDGEGAGAYDLAVLVVDAVGVEFRKVGESDFMRRLEGLVRGVLECFLPLLLAEVFGFLLKLPKHLHLVL